MLRSCRRRGWLVRFQHRGCKILLVVGTAQLLFTSIIYYFIGLGPDAENQSLDENPAGLFAYNLVLPLAGDLKSAHDSLPSVASSLLLRDRTTIGRIYSKFAKSAYQRAKTDYCKNAILEMDRLQMAGLLYYNDRLQGSCPSRNISKARFIGCFRDSANGPDLDASKSIDFVKDNTPIRCIEYCFSLGLPYAGVQKGVTCKCGARFGRHGALPQSRCDRPCPGNATLKCGGSLANSIYTTDTGATLNFVAIRQPSNYSNNAIAQTQPAKIAFILSLNGRSLRQIGRLLRVIYRPQHYYFIHVDTRLKYLQAELEKMTHGLSNVHVAQGKERFSSIWGGASLLTMLLSSYQSLLKRTDWKWDYVINLSETDFPIRPIEELELFLGANIKTNFILTHVSKTELYLSKQGMFYTFFECENRMWRLNERTLPRGVRMFGASDWVTLTRDFVEYLVEGNNRHDPFLSGLLRYFNYTLLPAESYFHTVLMNSQFCDKVANSNLRVVNWQRSRGCRCQQKAIVDWCGCSPNDLLEKDFPNMKQYASSQNPPYFFARKFEETINQRIINMIEFELLGTLKENAVGVDYFWLNEFSLSSDGPNMATFLKREPYYRSFAKLGLKALKSTGQSNCPDNDRIETITSAHSLSFKNVFHGLLVEFTAGDYTFEVIVDESPQARENKAARALSIDPVKNDDLEKLFAIWGYRVAAIEVGSDFDLKETVFRNIGSLLVTNQTGVCLALTWEKVSNHQQEDTTKPRQATTTKPVEADLIVSISSPDGTETSCTVVAHPADDVTCVCADAFKLQVPGIWRASVRSAGSKVPSVVFGKPVEFVVLSHSQPSSDINIALLSPAFWSFRDLCLVKSSSSVNRCFVPDQSGLLDPCSAKTWSSYSADVKSLPKFL